MSSALDVARGMAVVGDLVLGAVLDLVAPVFFLGELVFLGAAGLATRAFAWERLVAIVFVGLVESDGVLGEQ